MSAWVLVLIFTVNSGHTATHVGFSTRETCESGRATVTAEAERIGARLASAVCVKR